MGVAYDNFPDGTYRLVIASSQANDRIELLSEEIEFLDKILVCYEMMEECNNNVETVFTLFEETMKEMNSFDAPKLLNVSTYRSFFF